MTFSPMMNTPVSIPSTGGINYPPLIPDARRAPTTNDIWPVGTRWAYVNGSDTTIYETTGAGEWHIGGAEPATTTSFGTVELATLAELQNGNAPGDQVPTSNDVATVIAGVVAGAVPPANESQAGIAEIATQVETDAGTDDTRIVTPLKLANFISAGGGNGSFVDLTATGTVSFTGATGAFSITSATASDVGVTGGGIDLTLDSDAGQLILTGGEAAANAVRIQADNAAGGIDIDAGTGGVIVDSTGAISLDGAAASNFSVSGAEIDLNLASSGGRIIATAGEDAADAIYLHADAGTSETIRLHADQGTGEASIGLVSDVGGITLTSGLATNDAINLSASAGGVDIDGALQINIATSQSAADAIVINASAGGIDITNTGTAGEDIDIASSGASVNISSTENAAQSIYIRANGGISETLDIHSDQGTGVASINVHSDVGGVTVASGLASADAINITASDLGGGIDIDSGTAGVIVDTTGAISLDSAADSNFTVTGAFDLSMISTAGKVIMNGEEAAADALRLLSAAGGLDVNTALQINIDSSQAAVADSVRIVASAANGGMDIDAGTGGITIDTTGAISIDSAASSNLTVTGAEADLTLASVLGSVLVSSTENAALAIRLHANGGTSETIQLHSDLGTGVGSINLLSDVGGLTFRATGLASNDAINLEAVAGGIDMDSALQTNITSSQAAATAIALTASDGAGGITATTGTGEFNVAGGNLKIASSAKGLQIKTGAATDMAGSTALVNGTVTIANTTIATGDLIFLQRIDDAGSATLGELSYSIINNTSFTINSLILGTPGSIQTDDDSTVAYFIVRGV